MHRTTSTLLLAFIVTALAACGKDYSSGPAAGFECLGQALPTVAPGLITVSGQVRQNALSPNALRGAYIFAFRTGDTTTLAADTSDTPGNYSLFITTGGTPVNGYIRATDSAHITTYAYPAVPLAGDATENVLMITNNEFSFLAGAAGITPVAGKGFIGLVVTNCAGQPLPGATVSSNPAGTIRYNAGGAPSSSATSTADDGVAYIANVTAGDVTVQATASGHTLRQHIVNAHADAITLTEIRP
jgi:hypothetical protein